MVISLARDACEFIVHALAEPAAHVSSTIVSSIEAVWAKTRTRLLANLSTAEMARPTHLPRGMLGYEKG